MPYDELPRLTVNLHLSLAIIYLWIIILSRIGRHYQDSRLLSGLDYSQWSQVEMISGASNYVFNMKYVTLKIILNNDSRQTACQHWLNWILFLLWLSSVMLVKSAYFLLLSSPVSALLSSQHKYIDLIETFVLTLFSLPGLSFLYISQTWMRKSL